jgi:hypothetical protein
MNRDEIVTMLQSGICEVTFTKVNGELRNMPCTLKSDLLPVIDAQNISESKTRKTNVDNLSVWCTDKNEWRSFKVANVQKIVPMAKSWTVTLEEDPETGELILPFSDEILEEVGWKEGDVLEWIDGNDGTWSLVKKEEKKSK